MENKSWKGQLGPVLVLYDINLPKDLQHFQPDMSHVGRPQYSFQDCAKSEYVRGRLFWGSIHDCAGKLPYDNSRVSELLNFWEASVYHTDIADNLSRATAHLCERAAIASHLVEVIRKKSMQGDLAEVYKQLFLFLLETAKWFNKSGFSRFFDSFNKAVKEEHDVAVSSINDHIDIIAKKGFVEGLLSIEDVRQTGDIIEWKLDLLVPRITNIEQNLEMLVDELRIQGQFQQDQLLSAGYSMRSLLLEQFDSKIRELVGMCHKNLCISNNPYMLIDHRLQTIQNAHLVLDREKQTEVIQGHILSQPEFMVTREEAEVECRTLRALVYGTDGIAMAQESGSRLVDVNVISHLALWIQEATGRSRKLWIDYPFEFQEDSPARATALSIISIAARANCPFLSYICRKPRHYELTDSQTPETAGLLSMVYSLILQLLRFRPRDDGFKFDQGMLSRLSGDTSSWDVALALLSILLEHTVVVRYCIIHGLNELETGDGAVKCKDLLMALFSHSHRPENPLSMLFTTSGQSRALYEVIDQRDRASSNDSTKRVNRRGMDLNVMQI